MPDKELEDACYALAKESFEYTRIKRTLRERGETQSEESIEYLVRNGAWEKYLQAGGSRTMINHQLEDKDFRPQYDKLCKDAGIEP